MQNTQRRSSSRCWLWLALALLAAFAAGSATPSAARDAPSGATPTVHRVTISDMAFAAAPKEIRVGDVIEWVNLDVVVHTATADGGAWDVTIAPGKRARVTMKAAGVFPYTCRFHPNMRGTVTVKK